MLEAASNQWSIVEMFLLFSYLFTLSIAKDGLSIVISLATSATSKGHQVKTTEPMVSTKVTNCIVHSCWILGSDDFAKNYVGSRSEPKKSNFLFGPWRWGCRIDISVFGESVTSSYLAVSWGVPQESVLGPNNVLVSFHFRFF